MTEMSGSGKARPQERFHRWRAYKARLHLNNYQSDMSKFQLMRFLFALIFCGALTASPLQAQESSPTVPPAAARSEERRVGKECRSRGWRDVYRERRGCSERRC